MDEIPEIGKKCLKSLSQPLEDGSLSISRVEYDVKLYCGFHVCRGNESLLLDFY
ncbi:ATP-binding protein [Candidatus Latescibacterota bacterium]